MSPIETSVPFAEPYDELHTELRVAALDWLCETSPRSKAQQVMELARSWMAGKMALDSVQVLVPDRTIPGRPDKPELVPPLRVDRRSMSTTEGRAALIHALAHIEFNAINLALDAIWRFPCMPDEYYADWLKVAGEEAYHFTLLNEHLQTLGYEYGDFLAHNSLWDMTEKTSHDILARMALVPRTMEARGLDATPTVRAKLAQAGDAPAARILDIILRDEIGHVAIGNRWYNWLCAKRNLEPVVTYRKLAREFKAPVLRKPFNLDARIAAGFTKEELLSMQQEE
jgi:uncharacterized ferritin-like protein (DUF455 family)